MIYVVNGKKLENGQAVRVYRNIRKNIFSIQDRKTRRIIAYADSLLLTDVEMKVGRAGQLRVRKERQKNIHAFIVGKFLENDNQEVIMKDNWKPVYYNPYKTDTFINLENGEPVYKAPRGYLEDGKCFIAIEE
ncbi:hypothetical protein [Lysinibacillus antri]|uniref:Uncharacterized protein n=1 Tax=Lysinibacillus antri TaxID=2498145 RepID=A0A3S0P1N0_9BACI|nr:hypothetical protein [Lysinibacillus antri]RUL46529.1 hypothetical protein EK386_18950 [Lysinibacillus antri]